MGKGLHQTSYEVATPTFPTSKTRSPKTLNPDSQILNSHSCALEQILNRKRVWADGWDPRRPPPEKGGASAPKRVDGRAKAPSAPPVKATPFATRIGPWPLMPNP